MCTMACSKAVLVLRMESVSAQSGSVDSAYFLFSCWAWG